ncbi:MAG: deoxyribonuclease V [Phycisphaerae bacterium]
MKTHTTLHTWSVTPQAAIKLQRDLADRVRVRGRIRQLRLVAGADLAFTRDGKTCIAGAVVWDVARQAVVEQHIVRRAVRFPYIPGLLSFREAPAILAVLRKIKTDPDAFLFDGQGLAHPRRFGLACHVGILIDRPSIGCAKSRLIGDETEPGIRRGSVSALEDDGDCIGMVLRTRDRVKPIYVSVGHRVSLQTAVDVTMACCAGYRLPEPTRLADQLVARAKD